MFQIVVEEIFYSEVEIVILKWRNSRYECQFMLFISIYITSQVYWSDTGELVCIATEDEVYMLRYNPEKAEGTPDDEDGFEDAFEVLGEVADKIMTGWLAMETNQI